MAESHCGRILHWKQPQTVAWTATERSPVRAETPRKEMLTIKKIGVMSTTELKVFIWKPWACGGGAVTASDCGFRENGEACGQV